MNRSHVVFYVVMLQTLLWSGNVVGALSNGPAPAISGQAQVGQESIRLLFFKMVYWGLATLNDTTSLNFDHNVVDLEKDVSYHLGLLCDSFLLLTHELVQHPDIFTNVILAEPHVTAGPEKKMQTMIQNLFTSIADVQAKSLVLHTYCQRDYNYRQGMALCECNQAINKFCARVGTGELAFICVGGIIHELVSLVQDIHAHPAEKVLQPNEVVWVENIKKSLSELHTKKARYDYGVNVVGAAFWDGYYHGSCWWRFKRGLAKIGARVGESLCYR